MKKMVVMVILIAVCLVAAGAAFAAQEMTGSVTAVDMGKNTITVKGEKMEAAMDCETGSMLQGIKVGDVVNVKYDDLGKSKRAIKITPAKKAPKAAVGC